MGTILSFSAGVIIIVLFQYLCRCHRKKPLNKRTWTLAISSAVFIVFGLAWGITSIAEREPRAAFLGITIFTGFGIVLMALARQELLKATKFKVNKSSVSDKNNLSIKAVIAAALIVMSGILLPFTILTNKVSHLVNDSETVTTMFKANLLSNEALPKVIKKGVMYQNLLDSDTILLGQRMMLSIVSGVYPENWIKLFDKIMPENDRLLLGGNGVNSFYKWLNSEDDYPELIIQSGEIVSKVKDNAQFVMKWIFSSFTLPPSSNEQIAAYDRGEFPSEIEKFMEGGLPPEYLLEKVIPPAAEVLKTTIASANIPEYVSLSEIMAETVSAEELRGRKAQLNNLLKAFRYLWVFPILLIIIALGLTVRSPKQFLKWIQYPLFLSGIIGVILVYNFNHSIGIIESVISAISTSAPAPALGIVHLLFPPILEYLANNMYLTILSMLIISLVIFMGLYALQIIIFLKIKLQSLIKIQKINHVKR